MAFLNRCCVNNCQVGAVIPRWQNITKVRPAGDTGGTHYTSAPYPRNVNDPDFFDCTTASPGTCGSWLQGGDFGGVSAQEIEDTVDDIMACAGVDTTHVTSDHNCYFKDGTSTVDMRKPKRLGGQWILAKKQWHGVAGLVDQCDPHWITGVSFDVTTRNWTFTYSDDASWPDPYQTLYRTMSITVNGHGQSINPPITGTPTDTYVSEGVATDTVDQLTGVHTYGGSWSDTATFATPDDLQAALVSYFDMAPWTWNQWIGHFANFTGGFTGEGFTGSPEFFVQISSTEWELHSGTTPDFVFERISISIGGGTATCSREYPDFLHGGPPGDRTGAPGDRLLETLTVNNTGITYEWYEYSTGDEEDTTDEYKLVMALSDAYTSAQVWNDYESAMFAWDASDHNLAALRTDEELANAPLIIYDEEGASAPTPVFSPARIADGSGNSPYSPGYTDTWVNPGMPDYRLGLAYDSSGNAPTDPGYSTTWFQTLRLDGSDYIWKFPDGSYSMPSGFTGGATLVTPLHTSGHVIASNLPGSDPHFWFGFQELKRYGFDPGDGSTRYEWFNYRTGGTSDGVIPAVSMRWMDKQSAQLDRTAYTGEGSPPIVPGNYPQAFFNQIGQTIYGAKYVAATQTWPGTNFGRPCGPDKYAVDQLTVCCVMSGDHTSGYTVEKTQGANAPLATGGLASGDYIAVGGDGIYQISGITTASPDGDGNPQWVVMVGSKIDDLPTGFLMAYGNDGTGYMGALRWPSSSGICGRAAVTTSYASGTLTINATVAQPWLRLDPATGTIKVDLYDSAMTSGTMIGNVTLTRVSDTQWTAPMGSVPAITVAYMTGHGVDWTKYGSAPRKTGVHLLYSFDLRKAQPAYPSPPTWYADAIGCTGCTVTQFSFAGSSCPVLVGVVPFLGSPAGPKEGGPAGSQFFQQPGAPAFDITFSSHYQEAVMLTMPDPFYQQPFTPNCDVLPAGNIG